MPKFRDLAGKTFGRLTVRKYENYGGRGITICDEWKDNFAAFYEYVSKLEHFGEPGYSLDRIDNGIPRIYAWGVCQFRRLTILSTHFNQPPRLATGRLIQNSIEPNPALHNDKAISRRTVTASRRLKIEIKN